VLGEGGGDEVGDGVLGPLDSHLCIFLFSTFILMLIFCIKNGRPLLKDKLVSLENHGSTFVIINFENLCIFPAKADWKICFQIQYKLIYIKKT
jgi:hypothetical protein